MKSISKVIIISILILLVALLVLYLFTHKFLKDEGDKAKKQNVELALSSVKLSYNFEMLQNGGFPPHLEKVRESFSTDVAKWNDNIIYTTDGVECIVETSKNDMINVNCGEGYSSITDYTGLRVAK